MWKRRKIGLYFIYLYLCTISCATVLVRDVMNEVDWLEKVAGLEKWEYGVDSFRSKVTNWAICKWCDGVWR